MRSRRLDGRVRLGWRRNGVVVFALAVSWGWDGALPSSGATPIDLSARVSEILDTGDFARARTILEGVPRTDQTHEILFLEGKLHYLWGESKAAAELLTRCAAARPERSEYFLWLGRALGRRAEEASRLKAPFLAPKVREAFERAVKLDPDNLDARDDLLEYYLQAPGFLGGGKDKARALVEEIRSSHPFEYRLQKALIASDARRFDEAESEIRSAIRLDPIRVGGYLALADYHAQHKQRSQAREVLRGLVKRTPDSAEAHFALGRFELEGDGDLETAVRELRLFLEIYSRGAPYLFEGYYWLGEAFLRQKQPEEALAAFQQALRLFPAHAPSLKGRAAARKLEREEKIGLL